MSSEIATIFSRKFAAGIELTAQQIPSVLESTVDTHPDAQGEKIFFDQVGVVRMQPKTGRHVEIPTIDVPQRRRSISPSDFHMRDFLDKFDQLKVFNNPINEYSRTMVAAGQRKKDKLIIDAATGTALTGKEGATSTVLPAGQVIAVGGTGFTFAKLQDGIKQLRKRNAIMQGEAVSVVYTSFQEKEVLNLAEVKSFDYNTMKALVEGEVGTFYTCHFKRVEDEYDDDANVVRMLALSGTTRSCLMYPKSGIRLAKWMDITGRIEWNIDRGSFQVTAEMSAGATRTQETKVVQIDVVES